MSNALSSISADTANWLEWVGFGTVTVLIVACAMAVFFGVVWAVFSLVDRNTDAFDRLSVPTKAHRTQAARLLSEGVSAEGVDPKAYAAVERAIAEIIFMRRASRMAFALGLTGVAFGATGWVL